MMKYTIVREESGDWYIIPVSKLAEWGLWVESNGSFKVPDWAIYCQDPSSVTFDEYEWYTV